MFTFAEKEVLDELAEITKNTPEKRTAQNFLAFEICKMIHGESAAIECQKSSTALFSEDLSTLPAEKLRELFSEAPNFKIEKSDISKANIIDLFTITKLSKSKGEARRLIAGGGAYINEQRVSEDASANTYFESSSLIILRAGKKSYALLEIA